MSDRVLYISYNGLAEPLGRRQALPYVHGLSDSFDMSILSFEKSPSEEQLNELGPLVAAAGIDWQWLPYHKRPPLLSTMWDIATGIRRAVTWARTSGVSMTHARGYVPAVIARALKRRLGIPYVFDIRGLQAEEYVDGNLWKADSLAVRLTKYMERRLLQDASGLVTLTEAVKPYVRALPGLVGRSLPPWEVIPCCVDTEQFSFDAQARADVRADLSLGDRPVLVYSGSVGTWYLVDEMIRFFMIASKSVSGLALLFLVNDTTLVEARLRAAGVDDSDVRVLRVLPTSVPRYLAAADIGIAFIRPCLSKLASSPTKFAEYLACGLPVIANAGVGDTNVLSTAGGAKVLPGLADSELEDAASSLDELLSVSRSDMRQIAVERFSLRRLGVPRYKRLYDEVLSRDG